MAAPVAELCLIVQINDIFGNIVWETNSVTESLDLNYETGRMCSAVNRLECELTPGEYLISVGLFETAPIRVLRTQD
jgi:hypothetical protein